ncbi:DddA-like double-stranded DNA deaminase toxin [Streptomyces sp. NPDC048415]|uniref:DddA-like double-stranded DNA deaminase toxin n=1 Tax=Streptomyces sp. NPDC048415 TaxID=3154822 RepID=UPI00343DE3FF
MGPAGGSDCREIDNGCQKAIRAILPEGSSMSVWYPGATEPTIIPGAAAAP